MKQKHKVKTRIKIPKESLSVGRKDLNRVGFIHHPLGRLFFIFFAIFIFCFNFFVKIDIGAQSVNEAISSQNLLDKHNLYRKTHSIGELNLNSLLSKSAQNKADQMLISNCWSHYCPNGKSPWSFFDEVNYNYVFAGENLAEGFYNMDDLMTAWINSPSHRENIEKKEFTEVGFGIAFGDYQNKSNNIIVVAHFGSRKENTQNNDNLKLEITKPNNGSSINQLPIEVQGKANGFNNLKLILNNELIGNPDILNGIFTMKINNIKQSQNILFVEGNNNVITLDSNKINFLISEKVLNSSIPNLNKQQILSSSSNTKNLINLGFAVILCIIFLIDFLFVSKTKFLHSLGSFSHYHFVIFIVLALVIIVGGFSGNVTNGLNI